MSAPVDLFRQAMASSGLMYSGLLIPDGALHRFAVDGGNPRKKNCWYIFHDDDLPAGAFGCWQRRISETWCAKSERQFTAAEREQYQQRIEQQQRQREEERQHRQCEAKQKAQRMWANAYKPETADAHFYTKEKNLFPFGVRVLRGMLLIPVYSPARELVGLQLIGSDDNGNAYKRFLTGTPITGSYCTIGKIVGSESLAIGEGWATMASVHAATGLPCVVAFSAGNLLSVAKTMRARYPAKKIILCADDDCATEQRTGKNTGVAEAHKAALAVGGYVAMPSLHQSSEVAV
jgi:putative DNA primase/helicase